MAIRCDDSRPQTEAAPARVTLNSIVNSWPSNDPLSPPLSLVAFPIRRHCFPVQLNPSRLREKGLRLRFAAAHKTNKNIQLKPRDTFVRRTRAESARITLQPSVSYNEVLNEQLIDPGAALSDMDERADFLP